MSQEKILMVELEGEHPAGQGPKGPGWTGTQVLARLNPFLLHSKILLLKVAASIFPAEPESVSRFNRKKMNGLS